MIILRKLAEGFAA